MQVIRYIKRRRTAPRSTLERCADDHQFHILDFLDHQSLSRLWTTCTWFSGFPKREVERNDQQRRGKMFMFEISEIVRKLENNGGKHMGQFQLCLFLRQIHGLPGIDGHRVLRITHNVAMHHSAAEPPFMHALGVAKLIRIKVHNYEVGDRFDDSFWQMIDYIQTEARREKFRSYLWRELHNIAKYKRIGAIMAYLGNTDIVVGFLVGPNGYAHLMDGHSIEAVAVLPPYRKLGIGKQLVRAAEQLISSGGFSKDVTAASPYVEVDASLESMTFWSDIGYTVSPHTYMAVVTGTCCMYRHVGCKPDTTHATLLPYNAHIASIKLRLPRNKPAFEHGIVSSLSSEREYHIYTGRNRAYAITIYPVLCGAGKITWRGEDEEDYDDTEGALGPVFTVSLFHPNVGESILEQALLQAGVLVALERPSPYKNCKRPMCTLSPSVLQRLSAMLPQTNDETLMSTTQPLSQ